MISERLLRKWRKEVLSLSQSIFREKEHSINMGTETMKSICNRMLQMTQELLDQHLLNKK
uniref:Uncharacterized protein n=1 Tax=viral metagenome TaxID=1070528 RepID=A0A6H1ZBV3_9ZZZZ